jgi:hypothetical protein
VTRRESNWHNPAKETRRQATDAKKKSRWQDEEYHYLGSNNCIDLYSNLSVDKSEEVAPPGMHHLCMFVGTFFIIKILIECRAPKEKK